jgi:hypothetical protein
MVEDQSAAIVVTQLPPTLESFGAVTSFLAAREPFSGFDLGTFTRSIKAQLKARHHLAAVRDGIIVGYAGWLLTTEAMAEAWVAGQGPLLARRGPEARAAVLTTVAAEDPKSIPLLIRGARQLNPGKRAYFRRDNNNRGPRKNSVLIFSKDDH